MQKVLQVEPNNLFKLNGKKGIYLQLCEISDRIIEKLWDLPSITADLSRLDNLDAKLEQVEKEKAELITNYEKSEKSMDDGSNHQLLLNKCSRQKTS